MVSYKGSTVLAGVTWEYDTKTVTVKMAPASCNTGKSYKQRYTRNWKNECPYCKKKGRKYKGLLYPHGKKGRKIALEGEITCKSCDTDFDGVSGKSKEGKCKYSLTKGSNSSDTATKAESKINDKKTAFAEVKKDYEEKRQPKKDYKLIIPPLKNIKEGDYIELNPPLVSKTQTFFVGAIDTAQDDMQLTLYDKVPVPGSAYSPPNSNNSSSTTSITVSGANSAIEKTIMLKGKSLKSFNAIYKWLKKGNGNFSYKFYYNWNAGAGDPYKINQTYLKKRWNMKSGNCVAYAWIFYLMCKGAGIKVNVIHGKADFADGTYGHFWNKYKGKIYDCSSLTSHNFRPDRKVV